MVNMFVAKDVLYAPYVAIVIAAMTDNSDLAKQLFKKLSDGDFNG